MGRATNRKLTNLIEAAVYNIQQAVSRIEGAVKKIGDIKILIGTGGEHLMSVNGMMDDPDVIRLKDFFQRADSGGSGSRVDEGTGNDLLSTNGSFIDSKLESNYVNYLARKAKAGKPPKDRLEWKAARDYWLNDSPMARGNKFNKTVRKRRIYNYHEIHLENGKRLDSYDPIAKEIISRKAIDLDMIDEKTYRTYLKEMDQKYSVGTKIRSNRRPELDGRKLEGELILEIPASNKNLPNIERYKQIAKEYEIKLRFMEE
ncbi:hypothetical protein [Metabacillus fastidiosus]|uniref:hypothetical protein n=1 Tax=Metabacillus fastidiosus TaxID=1458 RepID=UPI002DB87081|nr:hypothetical protein [Metabacillus fastidiosus]MEC2077220.1 hypothetical protein [Metabacillus fastidiosus]